MDKQLREKTPMVFVTYDGPVRGTLHKRLVYDLDVNTGDEKVRINKLQIKFCYKTADEATVMKYLVVDEAVQAQKLPPVKPRKERFQMDTRHLAVARQKKLPLKIVLRGGETFTGNIDWYSHYEIKMSLGSEEGSVVVFRHAAFTYEVIGAPPLRESSYRRPAERSRPPIAKNAYPARRREE
jgi:sRNA-binding regulator protein Hfq